VKPDRGGVGIIIQVCPINGITALLPVFERGFSVAELNALFDVTGLLGTGRTAGNSCKTSQYQAKDDGMERFCRSPHRTSGYLPSLTDVN